LHRDTVVVVFKVRRVARELLSISVNYSKGCVFLARACSWNSQDTHDRVRMWSGHHDQPPTPYHFPGPLVLRGPTR